jgi:hypothetical protein
MSATEKDLRLLERVSSAVSIAPPAKTAPPKRRPTVNRSWNIPGVYSATRLSTSFGEVPAHLIRVRDQLRTRDGSFKRILRIDEYKLDTEFLSEHPEARPIRFSTRSRGASSTGQDILLSPAQPVLARGPNGKETLKRAIEFLNQPGVMPNTSGPSSYFVFHLGEAALVRAEGMWISLGE